MTPARNTGFAVVLALLAVTVVGASLVLLTGTSRALLFGSKQMYLDACNRNLAASGLAWARQNAPGTTGQPAAPTRKLPVDALDIPGGELTVAVDRPQGEPSKVTITTACRPGRVTIRREMVCAISD